MIEFWVGALLALTMNGPQIHVSPAFETKAECETAQEQAIAHPAVMYVTPCQRFEVSPEPKKTKI